MALAVSHVRLGTSLRQVGATARLAAKAPFRTSMVTAVRIAHLDVDKHVAILQKLGMKPAETEQKVSKMMANQSLIAGVSIRYLLSESFSHLAKQRTGLANPTFNDMKSAFWLCDDPIGHDIRCPRDGRMGCALVDWIPRLDRREQSHFLSWTWQYSLSDLQSALTSFGGSEAHAQCDIFFYVCFFVNNQFRIILESSQAGSEDL
ncbi:unnamed protein product, partial [Symbiodinium pilosum]